MKELERAFEDLRNLALNKVIVRAKKILKDHQNLDEFVLAMGGGFFTSKKEGTQCPQDFEYMRPVFEILEEYGDELHLLGEGVKFTAESKLNYDF